MTAAKLILIGSLSVALMNCAKKLELEGLKPTPDLPVHKPQPMAFKNCEEVIAYARKQKEAQKQWDNVFYVWQSNQPRGVAVPDMPASAQSEASNVTNLQEKGVDEADRVKVSDHHIFVSRHHSILVLDRKSKVTLGTIDLKGLTRPEIFVTADRLVVLSQKVAFSDDPIAPLPMPVPMTMSLPRTFNTIIQTYALSNSSLPQLIAKREFSGDRVAARLKNSRLYLVFTHASVPDTGSSEEGRVRGVPCNRIHGQVVTDLDYRLTQVVSLYTEDLSEESHIGVLGGGDHIYMTDRSLYIAKQGLHWFWWDDRQDLIDAGRQTFITKIALDQANGFSVAGSEVVLGRLRNQWAMKEFADHFVVATTYREAQGLNRNRLWSLSIKDPSGLKLKTKSEEFGINEDIRSIRYMGSKAYVVTFEKTDPLFVFDVSDPNHVAFEGELKVPGFSTYLHPADERTLVGVGYAADPQGGFSLFQGVQVSLFDVSQSAPKVLQQEVFGSRGSFLPATVDHHAFFYDKETAQMAVPVVLVESSYIASWWTLPPDAKFFSGALLFDVRAGSFGQPQKLTHIAMIPAACSEAQNQWHWWEGRYTGFDIQRLFRLDGELLSVSSFGLQSHTTGLSLPFPDNHEECQNLLHD